HRMSSRVTRPLTVLPLHVSASLLSLSTATSPPALSTLSLHDALPISSGAAAPGMRAITSYSVFKLQSDLTRRCTLAGQVRLELEDRKSTRLNSSHVSISYAVFCLKKKNISDNNNALSPAHILDTLTTN